MLALLLVVTLSVWTIDSMTLEDCVKKKVLFSYVSSIIIYIKIWVTTSIFSKALKYMLSQAKQIKKIAINGYNNFCSIPIREKKTFTEHFRLT